MEMISAKKQTLNKEQKKAVDFGKGPLLIIAGAGTGKTTVITERIKHIISSELAKPSEILALTFTEKAAKEMEERVDRALPYGYTQMWISTFHKFCDRILRQEGFHIGLNPAYRLLTDAGSVMLLRKNIFSLDLKYFRPLGNPTKFISGMLTHFDRLRDEDVNPTQYEAWVAKYKKATKSPSEEEKLEIQKYEELSRAYTFYQTLKEKEGYMDFADLISYALELFRKRGNILSIYQRQFKFFLVDEFQDTNIAQNELIVLLAGSKQNINAVCDDDQSIYKFRGAAVSNVLAFRKHFPKAKIIVLTENYRSTQKILDTSYTLIQNNNPDRLEVKEGINKKLTAARSVVGVPVSFIHADRVENEAEEVAHEIGILRSKGRINSTLPYDWKNFAILVRANNHADPFVRAFTRHGIPFQFLGPGQLFRQPEVKDLISYLQVLADIQNSVALLRVISMEYFDIPMRDIAALASFAKRYGLSLFEASEILVGEKRLDNRTLPLISDGMKEKLHGVVSMVQRHLGLIQKETAGQILFYFLEDSGIIARVITNEYPMDERKAVNITKFFNKIKTYEVDHEDASVQTVLDWIMLSMELGESPLAGDTDWSENDAVNILTIHSAKGLEFDVVFLVNLVSARFPTIERREQIPIPEDLIKESLPEGDYHTQEERRLFYVGMTRARDVLYLTAADYYGEGKREKKISPFVFEALGDTGVTGVAVREKQLSLLDWQKAKEQEPVEPAKAIQIDYLSYSQIETFTICPLHYKLRHILGVPSAPSAALSFGNSVHITLKEFYQRAKKGQSTTKKDLLLLLDEHWISEGYTNKRYESDMRKRGQIYLTEYFQKEFDLNVLPLVLEQPFTVPISAAGRTIKIGGKIDRVDRLSDGSIEIIDYKTGRLPLRREVDTSLQLSMYAIAATEIPTPPFGKKPDDVILSLYYFDTQEKISTKRNKQQLEAEKEKIVAVAKEIETSDFRCKGNQLCTTCEYQIFCGVSGQ